MSEKSKIEFEKLTDTITIVEKDTVTCGDIYLEWDVIKWEGEAVFDIKTACLTIADMERIIGKMKEVESESNNE